MASRRGQRLSIYLPKSMIPLYKRAREEINVSVLFQQALEDWATTGKSTEQNLHEIRRLNRKLRKIRAIAKRE